MKKRLAEIGGECQIESAPTQGTTVILHLLLPAEKPYE
jgi:signal transduction histidine kinase